MVGLDDRADRPAALGTAQPPRRGADATLEFVTDHAAAAADITLGDRTTDRRAQGLGDVFGLHMKAVDVVEQAVESLQHDRHVPVESPVVRLLLTVQHNQRIADHAGLWVLVKAIGLVNRPASRIHSRPVASPLPLSTWTPAKHGCWLVDPARGSITVTPVRMSRPLAVRPRTSLWPTRTPGTSVIALSGPGCSWPNWIFKSRARGFMRELSGTLNRRGGCRLSCRS